MHFLTKSSKSKPYQKQNSLVRTADRFCVALAEAMEAHPPPCVDGVGILPCDSDLGICPRDLIAKECSYRQTLKRAIHQKLINV